MDQNSNLKNSKKSKLRLIAYIAIIGSLTLGGLVFFGVSQFEKAKYKSSSVILTGAESQLKMLEANTEKDALTLDKIAWYSDIRDHFDIVNTQNANAYKGTAIPAYLLTTLALVSFGLCLKHADKVKEKEEDAQ